MGWLVGPQSIRRARMGLGDGRVEVHHLQCNGLAVGLDLLAGFGAVHAMSLIRGAAAGKIEHATGGK